MSAMPTKNEQLVARFASAIAVKPATTPSPAAAGQLGQRAGRTGDPTLFRLALDRIRPDEDQVRKHNKGADDQETRELADSIRSIGLKTPLQVRWIAQDDIFEIIAGERRYQAAKLAGLTDVPVHLENVDAKQARVIQLHENIHRAALEPIEIANALLALKADGLSNEQLAKTINKSESYVSKALSAVTGLTVEAKEKLAGPGAAVSMDHLYEVSKQPVEVQPAMLERIKQDGVTRAQLREETAADKKERSGERQAKGGRPAQSKPFAKTFKADNGGRVTVSFKKAKVTTAELIETLKQVLAALKA
jgi:ParB/RepB/Spo0J family partition protein